MMADIIVNYECEMQIGSIELDKHATHVECVVLMSRVKNE